MNLEELKSERTKVQEQMRTSSGEELERLQQREAELNEQIRQMEQGERERAQEAELQEIVLPHDFNKVFDDHRANEIIIEVIRDFQRQANAKHNEDIAAIRAGYEDQLRAAADRELQLQRQNRELQEDYDMCAKENAEQNRDIIGLLAERNEARTNRDNAARQLDEANQEIGRLKEHIEDLRIQLANAPAPKAAIEIEGTSKLDELVAQVKTSKESLADKVNRGLARYGIPPIEVPTLPVTQESPFRENTTPELADNRIPDPTEVVFRSEDIPATLGQPMDQEPPCMVGDTAEEKTVTRAEFEELERRVIIIENRMTLKGYEVA